MTKIAALTALALASLAITTGCTGADGVTRPPFECEFEGGDGSVEKNGPCEPCDFIQSGQSRDKNKPAFPRTSRSAFRMTHPRADWKSV